ncbi:MAG TPA: hypothetical protein PKE27_11165 [Povalibacter sp.]|uniref:hypothetical protein n=1 Tax=Povalibacter sp. TaxID=1962978 RepID=UPI002B97AF07|nr:hypothetical protein [Povalibacter sp.]HMN45128.1 hypothetical protein [Povalibacter sp.]
MSYVALKSSVHLGRERGRRSRSRPQRLGELCALALLAAANLAIHLFCNEYMSGMQQCIVELPLHLLVLLTAQHVLFECGAGFSRPLDQSQAEA